VGDQFLRFRWWRGRGELWLATDQLTLCVRDRSLEPAMVASAADDPRTSSGEVRSPMNARVSRVLHAAGDSVAEGAVLVTLEAMKIEHQVLAPLAGRLHRVDVTAGGQVQQGALLLVIEPGTP
jgi:biotin carboxyl carrier protein